MRHHLHADAVANPIGLSDAFCWTKYGTEAGEDIAAIVSRKEIERQRNHGVFLWGIGNAVGPSLLELVQADPKPTVVFTPMLSKAAARDTKPAALGVWHRAVGLDGQAMVLPRHSLVTSRLSESGSTRPHFALVCRQSQPLTDHWDQEGESRGFSPSQVVNLRSGSRVGSSQVTSIVRRVKREALPGESFYRVALVAELAPPYLVRLTACVRVPDALRATNMPNRAEPEEALDAMLSLRPDWDPAWQPEELDQPLPGFDANRIFASPSLI